MLGTDLSILQKFIKQYANEIFPADLSIKLARLKNKVDEEIGVYQDVLKRLINNCVEKDENNEPIVNPEGEVKLIQGKEQEWKKGYFDLENTKLDIKPIFTLEDLKNFNLTPIEADVLLKITENSD